ncbi:unnamed protein product [Phaeothamnion confervicola]
MAAVGQQRASPRVSDVELSDIEVATTARIDNYGTLSPTGGDDDSAAAMAPAAPYYWEAGGTRRLPWYQKSWHNVHYYGQRTLDGAELIGEVVANLLGLTESKYQYVIDAIETEQARKEQAEREEMERNELAEDTAAAAANSGSGAAGAFVVSGVSGVSGGCTARAGSARSSPNQLGRGASSRSPGAAATRALEAGAQT